MALSRFQPGQTENPVISQVDFFNSEQKDGKNQDNAEFRQRPEERLRDIAHIKQLIAWRLNDADREGI